MWYEKIVDHNAQKMGNLFVPLSVQEVNASQCEFSPACPQILGKEN